MINRAANDVEAIAISATFISKPAQEFGAFSWQGKCNSNHEINVERASGPSVGRIRPAANLHRKRSQARRMRYFSTICTTKLFFSPVASLGNAGSGDPDGDPELALP